VYFIVFSTRFECSFEVVERFVDMPRENIIEEIEEVKNYTRNE
jgi:hypothetical protein